MRLLKLLVVFLCAYVLYGCASKDVPTDSAPVGSEAETQAQTQTQAQAQADSTVEDDQQVIDYNPEEDGIIYFDFDKSAIKSSQVDKVLKQASYINQNPDASVIIEGHASEIGTEAYNIALGERRATSTKNALINKGVDMNRITDVISYGESQADGVADNKRTITKVEKK